MAHKGHAVDDGIEEGPACRVYHAVDEDGEHEHGDLGGGRVHEVEGDAREDQRLEHFHKLRNLLRHLVGNQKSGFALCNRRCWVLTLLKSQHDENYFSSYSLEMYNRHFLHISKVGCKARNWISQK